MRQAIQVEWWKIRRSRVTLVATAVMAVLLPAMGIGFYWVAINGGSGALAAKASAFLIGDGWVGYINGVGQIAAVAVLLGVAASVGPLESASIVPGMARLFIVAWSAGALGLSLGLVASIGRGYLPAIGALILVIAAAQIAVLFGTGGWFPYAVPGLLAVAGAEGIPPVSPFRISLVPGAVLAAAWLTVAWWKGAEVV